MIKTIDRDPPIPTGDAKRDSDAMYRYLVYLMEQLNYILTLIQREDDNGL